MKTKTIDLGGASRTFGRYSMRVDIEDSPGYPYPFRITMVRTTPAGGEETLSCDITPGLMQELIMGLTDGYMTLSGEDEE